MDSVARIRFLSKSLALESISFSFLLLSRSISSETLVARRSSPSFLFLPPPESLVIWFCWIRSIWSCFLPFSSDSILQFRVSLGLGLAESWCRRDMSRDSSAEKEPDDLNPEFVEIDPTRRYGRVRHQSKTQFRIENLISRLL